MKNKGACLEYGSPRIGYATNGDCREAVPICAYLVERNDGFRWFVRGEETEKQEKGANSFNAQKIYKQRKCDIYRKIIDAYVEIC